MPQLFRQVLWATSVNLVSAPEGFNNNTIDAFSLPATFFFDVEGINFAARSLDPNARVVPSALLQVAPGLYRSAVETNGLAVTDDAEVPRIVPGDTHFAFLVPERAAEDQVVLKELIGRQILSPRLALAMLMVDFANPVFSPRRAQLLRYVPETAAVGANGAELEEDFLSAVAATAAPADSPERELLDLFATPNLPLFCLEALRSYHAAIGQRLKTAAGVSDILQLADSRRFVCRRQKRALFEFEATLARSPMPPEHLEMTPTAMLAQKGSDLGEGEL